MMKDVDKFTHRLGPITTAYLLQSYGIRVADSNTRPHTYEHSSFYMSKSPQKLFPRPPTLALVNTMNVTPSLSAFEYFSQVHSP